MVAPTSDSCALRKMDTVLFALTHPLMRFCCLPGGGQRQEEEAGRSREGEKGGRETQREIVRKERKQTQNPGPTQKEEEDPVQRGRRLGRRQTEKCGERGSEKQSSGGGEEEEFSQASQTGGGGRGGGGEAGQGERRRERKEWRKRQERETQEWGVERGKYWHQSKWSLLSLFPQFSSAFCFGAVEGVQGALYVHNLFSRVTALFLFTCVHTPLPLVSLLLPVWCWLFGSVEQPFQLCDCSVAVHLCSHTFAFGEFVVDCVVLIFW